MVYLNIFCWLRFVCIWFYVRLKLVINDVSLFFFVFVNKYIQICKCNISLLIELLILFIGWDFLEKILYFDVFCFSFVNLLVEFVYEKVLQFNDIWQEMEGVEFMFLCIKKRYMKMYYIIIVLLLLLYKFVFFIDFLR